LTASFAAAALLPQAALLFRRLLGLPLAALAPPHFQPSPSGKVAPV